MKYVRDKDIFNIISDDSLTFLEQHRTVIVTVSCVFGLVVLILLLGILLGYIIIIKKIKQANYKEKQSMDSKDTQYS